MTETYILKIKKKLQVLIIFLVEHNIYEYNIY